jgi:hypothetical protein
MFFAKSHGADLMSRANLFSSFLSVFLFLFAVAAQSWDDDPNWLEKGIRQSVTEDIYGPRRKSVKIYIDDGNGNVRPLSSGAANTPPTPRPGMFNNVTGEFYAPAAGGDYIGTRDGTLYTPAGPNGVINTRTGEFIPTH